MSAPQAPLQAEPREVRERVLAGLSRLGVVLKQEAWQTAFPHGLNPTQGQILTLLQARGARRLRAAAEELGVTPATASDAVGALEQKGLVRKTRDPRDARALALVLTPRGRREAERLATWADVLLETVEQLGEEERAVLLRSIVKMIAALQQRGRIPAARVCASCRYFRPNAHADRLRPHHCAFVGAAFGDRDLRIDCPDHQPAAMTP